MLLDCTFIIQNITELKFTVKKPLETVTSL